MSLLNLDQARKDYTQWVTGTDDPPTLTEEEARLLSFRITAHHFPNLLAAHLALRDKMKELADEWERKAGGIEVDRITGTHLRNAVPRLRALVEEPQGGEQ